MPLDWIAAGTPVLGHTDKGACVVPEQGPHHSACFPNFPEIRPGAIEKATKKDIETVRKRWQK